MYLLGGWKATFRPGTLVEAFDDSISRLSNLMLRFSAVAVAGRDMVAILLQRSYRLFRYVCKVRKYETTVEIDQRSYRQRTSNAQVCKRVLVVSTTMHAEGAGAEQNRSNNDIGSEDANQ